MTKQFIVRLKKTDGTIVANSQIITVNGIGSGTILASDFTDGLLTGPVSTTNRSGSFVKTIAAPSVITYSITANVSSVNEPGTIQWTIAASGGTVTYPRTFQTIGTNLSAGINASDFFVAAGDPNWQEETVTMTGVGSLVLPFTYTQTILADTVTEGAETFQVSLYSWPGTSGAPTGANTLVATSSVITINDTSTSLTITYPSTSTHGTPFTWSISGAGANQTWYAETSGAFTARVPGTGTLAVDGSGAASYTNGDWGTISPGLTNNYGAVTVTFYFTGGPTITKTHTVSQAASTTPTPTPTLSLGSTPTPTPTPTRSQGSTPTPTPSPTPTPTPTPTQSQAVVTYGTAGLWSRVYDKYSGMAGAGSGSSWGNFAAYAPYPDLIPSVYDPKTSSRVTTISASAIGEITVFTGNFVPNVSGVWTFSGASGSGIQWADDYAGVYFGSPNYGSDNSILRSRTDQNAGDNNNLGTTVSLTAGTAYAITIMHANGPGASQLNLAVTPPGGTLTTDLAPYFFTNNLPSPTWPGVAGGHGSKPIGEGGAFFGLDTSSAFTNVPNRVLIGSVLTVTRIQIWMKLQDSTYSTTGVTYDAMTHHHTGIGGYFTETTESLLWDSNDSGNKVEDLTGSFFYINQIDSYNFGTRPEESLYYTSGNYVVGHRLKIWTAAMPFGGPPAFQTSASSTPFTDYIRQG